MKAHVLAPLLLLVLTVALGQNVGPAHPVASTLKKLDTALHTVFRKLGLIQGPVYGVIHSQPQRRASDYAAGLRARTLELNWSLAEPANNFWNSAYLNSKLAEYQEDRRAGFQVVLDFGIQYPPHWVMEGPDTHFVDQHGANYNSASAGANPLNAVFNQAVRDEQAAYIHHVFQVLGHNFSAVRLGFGRYGEIGYPPVDPASNSYWGFDGLALGKRPGLARGVGLNPAPHWQAGTDPVSAEEQQQALALTGWYLEALGNYQDWQIETVRRDYQGRLFMLYPSFGMRPGQLRAAVTGGLRGQTPAERNTDLQRGLDFERLVWRIRDPLVSPYTTWLDADGDFVNDASSDPTFWSPVHYLVLLSSQNSRKLQVWGENTGANSLADLERCLQRVRAYRLGGMFWAFNEDLYGGQHASIEQLKEALSRGQ